MKRILSAFLMCASTPALAQAPAAALRPSPPEIALPGDAALMRSCDGLLSMEKTYALARHWIDAWNSQSRARIMAMYTPDFEFRARGILNNAAISDPSGVLRGQADNRLRWFGRGATDEKGSQQFRLLGAYAGVRSTAIHYVNRNNELVVEVEEYAPDCKIERSNALYGLFTDGRRATAGD
jgi:hypothetical protein